MTTTKNYKGISVTFNTEDMNKKYIVYKLTFPNNKVYIGQTKQLLQDRISSHCYNSMSEKSPDYSTHKSRAIRKYQSFIVEVLGNCDNTLELDNLEIQMINIFDSVENGYNTQKGGSNSFDDLTPKEFEIFKEIVTEYHNNVSLEARKLIRLNKPYTSYYIEYLDNLNEEFNLEDFFKSNIFVIKKKPSNQSNFWEILDEVEKENNVVFTFKPVTDEAFKKYNWLEEAINKIGYNRMREIHNITRVKELLINMNGINSNTDKITKRLKLKLSIGDFISSKESKELFKTLYNELGIKKTAKGTDIMNYYEVKESTKKINNKSTNGFTIIRSKIIVKQ